MAERFAADLGFILLVLAVAWLLGFLIAWLLRGSKIKNLLLEIDDLKAKIKRLEADLDALQVKADKCESELTKANELNEALSSKLNKSYDEIRTYEKQIDQLKLNAGDGDNSELLAQLQNCRDNYASLKERFDDMLKDQEEDSYHLRREIESLTKANYDLNLKLNAEPQGAVLNFNGDLAKSVFGRTIKADDLTVVEGIGPKIAELCADAGIKNWYDLSNTPVATLKEILKNAGDRFAMHVPDTWPEQAQLAFDGKWKELLEYQEYLDGGKHPGK